MYYFEIKYETFTYKKSSILFYIYIIFNRLRLTKKFNINNISLQLKIKYFVNL